MVIGVPSTFMSNEYAVYGVLPTFCELGGVEVPDDLEVDGKSIAPVILGRIEDGPRRSRALASRSAGQSRVASARRAPADERR